MRIRITRLASVQELTNENLREEAEDFEGDEIQAATAVLVPDDGSGAMQGFFIPSEEKGMVVWSDDDSGDWIECESLTELFSKYADN
jgi:hypothetical protein